MMVSFINITPATADESSPIDAEQFIDEAFLNGMRAWMANPILSVTLNGQNKQHASLTNAEILQLDDQWVREREAEDQPLISARLSSPLSIFLLRVQALSSGIYTEIIVTDNRGLNAGQNVTTSDYWQGDEDKFKKTFEVGPDAVFIDKPEFHEATRTWRVQVNMTVTDPSSKEKIGSATVDVNLTEMKRRATS
jgi:hypothetical protein